MSERQIEALREAQQVLAELTGGDMKQSVVNLFARAVEAEMKARAALAAAERVAGFTEADEKNLRSHLATLAMAAVAGNKGDLAEATGEVIDFVRALALSPGKVEGCELARLRKIEAAASQVCMDVRKNSDPAEWLKSLSQLLIALPSPPISSRAEDS